MIRTLSCHCGQVRLECNAELGVVTECNCSTCARHGFLHWKVNPRQVRLTTPRTGLSAYVWRAIYEPHLFCSTCGVAICRVSPEGYFSLNARLLEGVDVFTLEVRRYDGLHDMPGGDMPPLVDPDAPPAA
jgi:hypothetical protein